MRFDVQFCEQLWFDVFDEAWEPAQLVLESPVN